LIKVNELAVESVHELPSSKIEFVSN